MKASKQSRVLIRCVENSVVWGGMDLGAAIQDAIKGTFPYASDVRQADLYATLMEGWESNPSGVCRRLFVKESVFNWNTRHVYGSDIDAANAAQESDTDE